MPKVSEQYRDARREEILDAARRCFARSGFQATSMQDLFAESGLSSGAIYRYFKSKDDMIVAIAEENMRDVLSLIHSLDLADRHASLGDAIAAILRLVADKQRETDVGQLAVIVWSEAVRNPRVKARFEESVAGVRADIGETVKQFDERGALPGGADAVTNLVISLIPGYILQLAMFGQDAVAGVADAIAALLPAS